MNTKRYSKRRLKRVFKMAPKMAPKGIQKDTQNVGVKIGVDFPAGPPKCRRENRCGYNKKIHPNFHILE